MEKEFFEVLIVIEKRILQIVGDVWQELGKLHDYIVGCLILPEFAI